MKIIFIAPPAAGKGTQSNLLSNEFNIEHISTGDLLREEVKSGNKELQSIIESGKLVNDELILSILSKKINNLDSYILDGFPRTINQAIALDELLNKNDERIDYVIYLSLDKEIAKKRILGRVSCPKCGSVYNTMIDGMNSKLDMICDNCNSELTKRVDDTEETLSTRYDTYIRETEPLIEYYKNKGVLYQVDSSSDTMTVYNDIKNILND